MAFLLASPAAPGIQSHGDDDDGAAEYLLPVSRNAQQDEAIADQAEQGRSQDGT